MAWQKAGNALEKSPVYSRATWKETIIITIHTYGHNMEYLRCKTYMFLEIYKYIYIPNIELEIQVG